MSDDVLGHIAYKIANAEVKNFPFPHIFVRDVFPDAFYDEIQDALPAEIMYSGIEGKYKGRRFNDTTELALLDPLRSDEFTNIAKFPFKKHISQRFLKPYRQKADLRLVMDEENYSIGPHTDAPYKVLSYLFYLRHRQDFDLRDLGTSIYLPRDPAFRCKGGPHHNREDFIEIARMPYIPNSLFAFFKTDFSFHGVEPITIPCRRDVLLWNLYGEVIPDVPAT